MAELEDVKIEYVNGLRVETSIHSKQWFKEKGKKKIRHRSDGPAIEGIHFKTYYFEGKLHNESGPAIRYTDGTELYYIHGVLHREDGPALKTPHVEKYFLNGKEIAREDLDKG